MKYKTDELQNVLTLDQFPRSSKYDPDWMLDNRMGPNAIWLAEALSQQMELKPGMKVLDLGCGKATSSIFFAKEFGVSVWATDLWIDATENWQRIQAARLETLVYPIHAEAHHLPFARGFFDAIVSLDAYHYFGTDDLYFGQIVHYLRPGGQIGIVVPGLVGEFTEGVPSELVPYWEWEFGSFHSPEWWRNHWEKTGFARIEVADMIPDGWKHWLLWQEVSYKQGVTDDQREAEMLRIDAGQHIGFTRMVGRYSEMAK